MQVITIAARKGGVGKTTLATHFSVIASADNAPVLLFDTDPQHSLAWWWRLRPGKTPAHAIISGSTVGKYEPEGRAAAEIGMLWREVQSKLRT